MENSKKVKTKENAVEKVDKALNSNPLKKRATNPIAGKSPIKNTPAPKAQEPLKTDSDIIARINNFNT